MASKELEGKGMFWDDNRVRIRLRNIEFEGEGGRWEWETLFNVP